jgi:hypothetical protein
MRIVTFRQSAGDLSQAWTVDHDCNLVAASCYSGAIISADPQLTYTVWTTYTDDSITESFVVSLGGGSSGIANVGYAYSIPLSAGRRLFVSTATAGFVQLYLDDIITAEK